MASRNPFRRSGREDDPFESPWDDSLFGDLFSDFDDRFRQMRRQMARLFERARKGELPSPEEGGPYVYGWTFRWDSGHEPVFQEFGNVRSLTTPALPGIEPGTREPLTDVIETDRNIRVTFELPGIEKEDIDVETGEDHLTVRVERGDRKYYKSQPLPGKVVPDSARATYKNGVLEVTIDRAVPKSKGKRVPVE